MNSNYLAIDQNAEEPAFTVITNSHAYSVYASGRIFGFPGSDPLIINLIPGLLAKAAADSLDRDNTEAEVRANKLQEQLDAAREQVSALECAVLDLTLEKYT